MAEQERSKPDLRELYPDVFLLGGLVRAIEDVCQAKGYNLEARSIGTSREFDIDVAAAIETDQGSATVYLAADDRSFLIDIGKRGSGWASGSTADIGRLADSILAWATGISLDEFMAQFEFMKAGRMAHALETGDATTVQWEYLLSEDLHGGLYPLLLDIHGNFALKVLYPTVSMGRIRLSTVPAGGNETQLLITPLSGGGYRVGIVGVTSTERDLQLLDEVVPYLLALLGERST